MGSIVAKGGEPRPPLIFTFFETIEVLDRGTTPETQTQACVYPFEETKPPGWAIIPSRSASRPRNQLNCWIGDDG